MKVMFWNIFKLSSNKLYNKMNQGVIARNGMGNTILDYITKVVMGDAVWSGAGSTSPVDAFIIIELVGGGKRGQLATGKCLPTLNALKGAMNAVATRLPTTYTYDFVLPKITGHNETVGILYNTATLTHVSDDAMRLPKNLFLSPRTPFWAQFTKVTSGAVLNLIGIHGPTSQPNSGNYASAVAFTNQLGDVAQIAQVGFTPKQATLIGGDYNCDGNNSYSSGNGPKRTKKTAFDTLTNTYKYSVPLAPGTQTSLLAKLDQTTTPWSYLSEPYDNIVCLLPGQAMPPVKRVDLCAGAPVWTTNGVAVFKAAHNTSDHLPVSIEW